LTEIIEKPRLKFAKGLTYKIQPALRGVCSVTMSVVASKCVGLGQTAINTELVEMSTRYV